MQPETQPVGMQLSRKTQQPVAPGGLAVVMTARHESPPAGASIQPANSLGKTQASQGSDQPVIDPQFWAWSH